MNMLLIWIIIGSTLGIVIRFFVPFFRKIGEGQLEFSWREIEIGYVVKAVIALLTTILFVYGAFPLAPFITFEPFWGLVAFLAGIGQMEIINELIKVAQVVYKKRTGS